MVPVEQLPIQQSSSISFSSLSSGSIKRARGSRVECVKRVVPDKDKLRREKKKEGQRMRRGSGARGEADWQAPGVKTPAQQVLRNDRQPRSFSKLLELGEIAADK